MKVFFKSALNPSQMLRILRGGWSAWEWAEPCPDISAHGKLGERPIKLQIVQVLLPSDPTRVPAATPESSPYYVLRLKNRFETSTPSLTVEQARADERMDDDLIQRVLAAVEASRVSEDELRHWINRTQPGGESN